VESFKLKFIKDITVVKVDLIDATLRDAQPFWEEMERGAIFNHEKIIIDLSACTYVDSTFIGIIISFFRKVTEKKNQLKLVYPQKENVINFWALGLTKVIECFDTLKEAADSFDSKFIRWRTNFDEEYYRN
jgi:anti-anti-sigma regulatory factor